MIEMLEDIGREIVRAIRVCDRIAEDWLKNEVRERDCDDGGHKPVAIWLALPTITTVNGENVNLQLANDSVATITIVTKDSAGVVVPAPPGDTYSVVSGTPASLGAAIGKDASGNAALVLTPLVQVSSNLSVVVSDNAGLTADTLLVDIVADLAPKAIGLDTTNEILTPQAVPTNPGP